MDQKKLVVLSGIVIGAIAVILTKLGNPANMGMCVACFIRDIAGGLGLHRAEVVQYIRPEVPGFILGSFLISLAFGEFNARGGSATLTRFIIGFFVMVGAMVFLGCPLRMVLRLSAGDLNALFAFFGFASGIYYGLIFIKKGFSLGRSYKLSKGNGYIMPLVAVVLLILVLVAPSFIFFSAKGPGSMRAPFIISLAAGLIVGALAQRSRLCMAGGIRDIFLLKDFHLFSGFAGIFTAALILNIVFGNFKLGFEKQPIAHTMELWNFLGMFLAGFGSILLGGCPLRQCILAGEGDTDAGAAFFGMLVGAAFSHNFGISASVQGVGTNGKIAVILGIIFLTAIALLNIPTVMNIKKESEGAWQPKSM
ncbi:YedE family putative selenium transporter [Thermovenabulum sp.]|uniref:YedE family putative selenium transporter n=1 Tax=Thermovenabulum sp. TaxID=3100335 RepID=UPI003C7B3B77